MNNMLDDLLKHYGTRYKRLRCSENIHNHSHLEKSARKMLRSVEKKIDKVAYNQWHTKKAREFYFKFAK